MSPLELRAIAYLLAALGCMCVGGYLSSLHYRSVIVGNQAQVATAAAQAAVAAKAQQDTANANNARIIAGLQSKIDGLTASSGLLAQRLQNARAGSRNVPQAPDKPGAPPASGEQGDEAVVGLLRDALNECQRNVARFEALQAEVKPQL